MTLRDALRSGIAPIYIRARLLQERIQSGVVWNPFDPDYLADPYPACRRLRERDPCHYSPLTGMLVLSRYQDVDEVLRDHRRFGSVQRAGGGRRSRLSGARRQLNHTLPRLDPPDHTRLRGLAEHAFTAHRMEEMENWIRDTVHAMLDRARDPREFDLMSTLATPLPVVVIAEMIGVPSEKRQQFDAWAQRIKRISEPSLKRDQLRSTVEAMHEFDRYFAPIVEARRDDPADDLVSRLTRAEQDGQTMNAAEILATLRLLLMAGCDPPTDLIGNGLHALLEHPEQLQLLRERPDLIPDAVEELLRYDAPVQLGRRYVNEDVRVGNRLAKAGSQVVLLQGAANRDPEAFRDPDTLDVTRKGAGHLSFAQGIHRCMGAPLARLIGRVVLEGLLERFGSIRFGAREPLHKPSYVFRGFRYLDIRVRRRSGRSFPVHRDNSPP